MAVPPGMMAASLLSRCWRQWAGLSCLALACSSSPVPALTAASLPTPRLSGLEPREISVSIVDSRPLPDPERRETAARLGAALREAFGAGGMRVQNGARNRLLVELSYPNHGAAGMDAESCIEMTAELEPGSGPKLQGTALGCAELRNLFGMSYGPDTSAAFQHAADALLTGLESQHAQAQQMTAPPRFAAAAIRVPPFSRLSARELELIVVDEWSADGALGRNLQEELAQALRGAGLTLTAGVAESLSITLSKPDANFQGRSRHTCLQIAATARLRSGSAFSHATACRGPEQSLHHQTLNEVLKALDVELDSLPAPARDGHHVRDRASAWNVSPSGG